ncbi:MAG TPA: dihydroneopterin aldolase family protein [Methanobacterium sp.]|nr:dihydroneopterin aldolase family protein [Methanobacterium sp.]
MDVDEKYFKNISHRERAIFEGAITMGALFHQFDGTPVNLKSVESLENAMQEAMELQPCTEKVEVTINRKMLEEIENEFEYTSLNGNMLDVKIMSVYRDKKAIIRLKFIKELDYPLMYVEHID